MQTLKPGVTFLSHASGFCAYYFDIGAKVTEFPFWEAIKESIELNEVDPKTFKHIVQYLYFGGKLLHLTYY